MCQEGGGRLEIDDIPRFDPGCSSEALAEQTPHAEAHLSRNASGEDHRHIDVGGSPLPAPGTRPEEISGRDLRKVPNRRDESLVDTAASHDDSIALDAIPIRTRAEMRRVTSSVIDESGRQTERTELRNVREIPPPCSSGRPDACAVTEDQPG